MKNNPKFVLDTNVIVSASLFSKSAPRQAFDKAQDIDWHNFIIRSGI